MKDMDRWQNSGGRARAAVAGRQALSKCPSELTLQLQFLISNTKCKFFLKFLAGHLKTCSLSKKAVRNACRQRRKFKSSLIRNDVAIFKPREVLSVTKVKTFYM